MATHASHRCMTERARGSFTKFTNPSSVAFVYIVLKWWAPDQKKQDDRKAEKEQEEDGDTTQGGKKERLCGRKKNGPSFLKPEILKEYEAVRKEMVQRFKDADTMGWWNTWWRQGMRELIAEACEDQVTPPAKRAKTTEVVEMEGFDDAFADWKQDHASTDHYAAV
jgi:hypothetical protein